MLSLKNYPKWPLANKGYVQDVIEFVYKENPSATDAEVNGKVEEILEAAGYFNKHNKKVKHV